MAAVSVVGAPDFILEAVAGKSLDAIVDEVVEARVWGIHYRTSDVVGAQMGRDIGKWVVQKSLKRIEITGK